jgi:hypothetical protein
MLKESCPYHKGPVKQILSECYMLQLLQQAQPLNGRGNKKVPDCGDNDDKGDGFPDVHNCYIIFGGDTVNMSSRQRK